MNWKPLQTPFEESVISTLRAGERLLLTGTLYTARDEAHRRIEETILRGEKLPIDLGGTIIYYAGPSPTPPGRIAGAAGPTTSSRMDPFTETMIKLGVKGFLGKGRRSMEVRELLKKYGAVYFGTFGGAAAYLSKHIIAAELVAFPDLGPEAIYRYEVRDFPVIVANDSHMGDVYEHAIRK